MILLEEAQAAVLGSVRQMSAETVELQDAVGRVVAEDVSAREDIPSFSNSAMDGYAVRGDDVAVPGALLRVTGEISAGHPPDGEVEEGAAMKIMTGAPMPPGADTVVRVEDTERLDDVVKIVAAVAAGTSVRPPGSDIPKGTPVFARGTRLQPTHLGVLAAIGSFRPLVSRRPRVTVFSTGDELTSPSAAVLRPGQIRDTNSVLLRAFLAEVATVFDYGVVRDNPIDLHAAFARAAAESDAVITSGGVSMGDHDHVRDVLSDLGEVDFWKVAIKPAKPFAYGIVRGVPFFGLPGNPVSAVVAYEQLVRPALLAMQSASKLFRPRVRAIAGEKIQSDPDRLEFMRVGLDMEDRGRLVARSSGSQGSHVLSGLAAADGFGIIPVGTSLIKAGQGLDVELFRSPETRRWIHV